MTNLESVPIHETTKVFNGAQAFCDRWWIVRDGNILFHDGYAPQCNSNKEIAERIRDKLYPDADVQFLPVVYRPQRRRL